MFRVYVVQLRWRAYEIDAGRKMSPSGLPYLYVGSTWHTPERRLANHRIGGSGTSTKVRNFGLGLRPELFLQVRPVSYESAAKSLEREWAERLAEIGFTTRSDGVLRRPAPGEMAPSTELAPQVEDFFDEMCFQIAARRGDGAIDEIADQLQRCPVPDARWQHDGRFAHVDPRVVQARLRFLSTRGYLAVAAGDAM